MASIGVTLVDVQDEFLSKGLAGSTRGRRNPSWPEKGRLHPLIRLMVRAGYTGGAGKKGIYDFYKEVLSEW